MKLLRAALRTIWVYSTAGALYIVVNAWVHPQTLPLMLTHLTPWIREDTFGVLCAGVSLLSFFALQLLGSAEEPPA